MLSLLDLFVVDAQQEADGRHGQEHRATAIADKDQRHADNRQNAAHHGHIGHGLTDNQEGHSSRQQKAPSIPGVNSNRAKGEAQKSEEQK